MSLQKLLRLAKKNIYPVILTIIVGILAWTNYEPGTWLSGWDTLHPEFNFTLYLERILSVWQEHQGVGALASQAHATELFRLPILWLFSLVLPASAIRYAFFFLTWLVGVLGMYYFLNREILKRFGLGISRVSAFLAALFYLLNPAMMQQFNVPFEMFAVHFATLPWLYYLVTKYLSTGKRKWVLWLGVITLFASSMAHTSTLFYAYLVALCLYLGFYLTFSKRRKTVFKRGLMVGLVTILTNLYWLLPNIYFVLKKGEEVVGSKIHSIFSGEALLQSKSFGTWNNLFGFKNFLFSWYGYDVEKGVFEPLLGVWESHLNVDFTKIGLGVVWALVFVGIAIAFYRKNKKAISMVPLLLLSTFFIINANFPFEKAFSGLQSTLPLLKEALRFPFTKFSILLTFSLSVFLALGSTQVLRWLNNRFNLKTLQYWCLLAGTVLLISLMRPAFAGEFISPLMRVQIPNEYFQVFEWFGNQPEDARVAKLPLITFWGWNFYSWDYQGAGFTWFGIKQPTFDREFDRWSQLNEQFYNEVSFAFLANDAETFKEVLHKYRVKYLLLDESVIDTYRAGVDSSIHLETKEFLNKVEGVEKVAGYGFLNIYDTGFANANGPFYVSDQNLPNQELDIETLLKDAKLQEDSNFSSFAKEKRATDVKNCSIEKKGSVETQIKNGAFYYGAYDGGVNCDYFSYPNVDYQNTYLIRIKGQNINGRSLRVYVFNWERSRMEQELLMPDGEFDEYILIRPKQFEGKGYTLNVETRSFGSVASENIIEKIEIFEFPHDLLTKVMLASHAPQGIASGSDSVPNGLEIKGVERHGTSRYTVETSGLGLLVLGQGYDEGWVAFTMSNGKCQMVNGILCKSLPWFFGEKLEHVKVNSWANGWYINNGQCQMTNDKCNIVIFYWPQYLEYLGFVILIGTFVYLLVDKHKSEPIK